MNAVEAEISSALIEAGVKVTATVTIGIVADKGAVSAQNQIGIRLSIDQVQGTVFVLLGVVVTRDISAIGQKHPIEAG
jgi:hypothetical protein